MKKEPARARKMVKEGFHGSVSRPLDRGEKRGSDSTGVYSGGKS